MVVQNQVQWPHWKSQHWFADLCIGSTTRSTLSRVVELVNFVKRSSQRLLIPGSSWLITARTLKFSALLFVHFPLVPLRQNQINVLSLFFFPSIFIGSFRMTLNSIDCPHSGLREFLSKSSPLLTPKSLPISRTWVPHMSFPTVNLVSACVWQR